MYPATPAARDRFVLERRGARVLHDPWRYQDVIVEDERTAEGLFARVATVFLTGRECPWRCTMCDLWRYTTEADTLVGAIPAQVRAARRSLRERGEAISQIKLYNAGSFFDPVAVPSSDYLAVAEQLDGLDRVIVESHPALIGRNVDRFLEALDFCYRGAGAAPRLEVAMGLETAHPRALEQLHKRMTIGEFSEAAEALRNRRVALRVFLLISPPFIPPQEQDDWLLESIDVAFSSGAGVVSLIPTRSDNGAMETLTAQGLFRAPTLDDIERAADLALARDHDGRIFVDLWNLDQFSRCPHCFEMRRTRLHAINSLQRSLPRPACPHCEGGAAA